MKKMMESLTDEGIIESVIEGASLRTVMIPDDVIPSNNPLHIESYDLPHVIVNGGYFWGKSETAHLGQTLGQPPRNTGSFCYTNIGNIFSYFSHDPNTLLLYNKKRYKSHSWRTKGDFRLVWDSLLDQSSAEVKKEIESGSKFKIAMLDSEYIWNIHPIDLPTYFPKENRFELKTNMDWYPTFLDTRSLREIYLRSTRIFSK